MSTDKISQCTLEIHLYPYLILLSSSAFLLNWHATSYHLPIFLAQAKGYYADEGIKVALLEPNDPSDVTEIIGSGKVDMGCKAMIHVFTFLSRGGIFAD
jgi:ABC-type nitrate/sulfonate/bicarbonate transport system substrate-binding protein